MSGSRSTGPRARLAVEHLEDRTVPAFLSGPAVNVNGVFQPSVGLSVAAGNVITSNDFQLLGLVVDEYVLGTGPGVDATVRVYSQSNTGFGFGGGTLLSQFDPYPGIDYRGGINVAVGDVLGDNALEIIVAPAGTAPPFVSVYDANGQLLSSFLAFPALYTGGLTLAVGNVLGGDNANGFPGTGTFKQEIVVGTATQFAFVAVTDGVGNGLRLFEAIPGFTIGVNVATGNIDTDPAGDLFDEIIIGGASRIPVVGTYGVSNDMVPVVLRNAYFAFPPSTGAGVTLAAGSTDGSPGAEVYASLVGTARLRVFNGINTQLRGEVQAFPAGYSRVLNISSSYQSGLYDPNDPTNFDLLDIGIVAGDGPQFQRPRFFFGLPGIPAGLAGP